MADLPTAIVKTFSLHGGMDDRNPPWILDDNHAVLIENLEVDRPGKRTRRRATGSVGAASGVTSVQAPGGLWPFYDRELGQEVLYGVWDGHLRRLTGTAQIDERACGVSLTLSLHTLARGIWRGLDTMYVSQAQYNDSSVSLASKLMAFGIDGQFSQCSDMAPRFALWWQGRMWALANSLAQDDQTMWWSSLNDGLAFSANNTFRIESGRGGRLVAMVPIRAASPRALIFKERLTAIIETYWGSSSALIPAAGDALDTVKTNIHAVSENVGCVGAKTIQYVPGAQIGDILFLAHDGIRAITRAADDTVSGSSLPVSAPIQGTIDRINFSQAHKAASTVWEQKYHLAVPLDGATKNTHVISYDLVTGAWYLNTWDGADLTVARLTQLSERLFMQYGTLTADSVATGSYTGWHVFRGYTGDVDPGGTPVAYTEDSKAYTFGTVDQKKKWTWVGIHAFNENASCPMDVAVRVDNDRWQDVGTVHFPKAGGTAVILGTTPLPWGTLPNGVVFRHLSLEDVQPGYMIQLRLTQTSPSDWSRPTIIQTAIAARPIPHELDNSL